MVINPVSYCLRNRGHRERDIQSVRRDLPSHWQAGPLFASCPLLPRLPSHPPPPQAVPAAGLPLASTGLPTFVSTTARAWGGGQSAVCLAGAERLDAAGPGFGTGSCAHKAPARPPLTPDSARAAPASAPPAHPGGLRGHRATLRTLVAALVFLLPSRAPPLAGGEGERAELPFIFSSGGGLCLLSIPRFR